jgi:hypothetical protein
VHDADSVAPAPALAAADGEVDAGTDAVAVERDDCAEESSELHCSYERTDGADADDVGPVDSSDDERRRPERWNRTRSSGDETYRQDQWDAWEAEERCHEAAQEALAERDMEEWFRDECYEPDRGYNDYDGS